MNNFFEHQDRARKNTGWLIALFALSVVLITFAVNIAALSILGVVQHEPDPTVPPAPIPDMFFTWVTGITLLTILAGTLYKIAELGRGGGAAVAEMFEGKYLSHSTLRADRLLSCFVELD